MKGWFVKSRKAQKLNFVCQATSSCYDCRVLFSMKENNKRATRPKAQKNGSFTFLLTCLQQNKEG
jgi:hypothetical protein